MGYISSPNCLPSTRRYTLHTYQKWSIWRMPRSTQECDHLVKFSATKSKNDTHPLEGILKEDHAKCQNFRCNKSMQNYRDMVFLWAYLLQFFVMVLESFLYLCMYRMPCVISNIDSALQIVKGGLQLSWCCILRPILQITSICNHHERSNECEVYNGCSLQQWQGKTYSSSNVVVLGSSITKVNVSLGIQFVELFTMTTTIANLPLSNNAPPCFHQQFGSFFLAPLISLDTLAQHSH